MRPYVKEVEFNIQGGGKFKLGSKTLIVGANRIGKSTITRAIELPLSGRASDIAGRESLALDADLYALKGDASETAQSCVTLSNDTTADWTLQRGKKAKRTGPSAIFPLRDVRDAIKGNAETVRKFFLSVAADVSWDEVIREIPETFRDKLTPYRMKNGADGLLAAIEGSKKRVREMNAEAKSQRETATAMGQGLAPEPSPDEVKKARESAGMANAGKLAASLTAQMIAARERANSARAKLDAALAKLDSIPAVAPIPEVVTDAMNVAAHLAEHNAEACAVCGSAVAAGTFQARYERAFARLQDSMAAAKSRALAESEVKEAKFEDGAANADLLRISRTIEEHGFKIGDGVEPPDVPDFEAIIRTAERWNAIRTAEGAAVQKEADATIQGQITSLCTMALERILTKSIAAFEAKVQGFLPDSMRFGIELQDGDRAVCRVGFRQPGGLRTALSGAEWATMSAALAAVVAERTGEPNCPAIIGVEDRDFDPSTLGDVMAAFSPIDAQVIITSTKMPAKPTDGWTVINLNEKTAVAKFEAAAKSITGSNYCDACSMVIIGREPCSHGVQPKSAISGNLFDGM